MTGHDALTRGRERYRARQADTDRARLLDPAPAEPADLGQFGDKTSERRERILDGEGHGERAKRPWS